MQHRSEETRVLILSAASDLFSRQGYNATGVSEICAAARVSKGAFYYHFPTKQALFLELLNLWLVSFDQGLEQLRGESKNVVDALYAMASMAGNVLQSSESNRSILIEFWMQAYRDPAIWQAAIAPYQRYVQFFSQLFQQGIEEGTLERIEPDSAARVIVGAGLGILLQALFDKQGLDWDGEIQQSVEYLLNGIARRQV
jgi:AcrR family transcriptional regulator